MFSLIFRWRLLGMLVSGLLISVSARAWGISDSTLLSLSQGQMMHRSLMSLQDAVYGDTAGDKKAKARPRVRRSPLDLGKAGVSSTGKSLSSTRGRDQLAHALYPRQDFAKGSIVLNRLIMTFHQNAERLYGVPANHLASAVAASMAGGYAAYTNTPFRDEWVQPLVAQLNQVMSEDATITGASLQKKIDMHQILVGMGMYLMTAQLELQQGGADPTQVAELRQAGGDYLRAMLGVDPDRLQFSTTGVRVN